MNHKLSYADIKIADSYQQNLLLRFHKGISNAFWSTVTPNHSHWWITDQNLSKWIAISSTAAQAPFLIRNTLSALSSPQAFTEGFSVHSVSKQKANSLWLSTYNHLRYDHWTPWCCLQAHHKTTLKLHAYSVLYAHKLTATRHALEKKGCIQGLGLEQGMACHLPVPFIKGTN